MLLMIDNYDSFTYNLVQYLGELGADVQVYRNDALTLEQIAAWRPERIVVSPGPCTPSEAGICVPLIQRFAGEIPILGVCLGHQAIGQAFGGRVVRAGRVMHGKLSAVTHREQCVFAGLQSPLTVTRYHSLAIDRANLRPASKCPIARDCSTSSARVATPRTRSISRPRRCSSRPEPARAWPSTATARCRRSRAAQTCSRRWVRTS